MISGNFNYGGFCRGGLTDAPHCGITPSGPTTVHISQTEALKPNFEQFNPRQPDFEQFNRKLK